MQVSFQSQNCCFLVDFNESQSAQEIIKSLPIDSKVSLWGDEIFFETNITISDGRLTKNLEIGDVAYWPDGKCICIFFGKTPASQGAKPVPATPVVVIGKTTTLPDDLKKIQAGHAIRVLHVAIKPAPPVAQAQPQFERKLSQSEIDDLVKQILTEKERQRQAQV